MLYYNFRTQDQGEATAALLVFAVYQSRDKGRLKVTPDLWGRVERFTKGSAKRARDLAEFIERLKPKLACSTIKPQYARTHTDDVLTMVPDGHGGFVSMGDRGEEKRQFLTELLEEADDRAVLDVLYGKTALVILLVRDRIEREKKVIEAGLVAKKGGETPAGESGDSDGGLPGDDLLAYLQEYEEGV